MRRTFLILSGLVVLAAIVLSAALDHRAQGKQETTPTDAAPQEAVLFDDFDYEAYDDPALSDNGWIVRTADGWPGVPGAVWREENVTFVDDPDDAENRLLQMTSSIDGAGTYQTQICQQRKFYEGTYASRVRFSDTPAAGPDGDNVVQTFYLISPQEYDLDPDYSELDYEYLPNGGWGFPSSVFFATTWETFQLEPWIADNASEHTVESLEGWRTLVIQIADGEANYHVDGEHFATHGGKYFPEVPMSINFNLWFINGGQIRSAEPRHYIEQIDWVYFVGNAALTPGEIEERVATLRAEGVSFTDSAPPWDPPLESPCNF